MIQNISSINALTKENEMVERKINSESRSNNNRGTTDLSLNNKIDNRVSENKKIVEKQNLSPVEKEQSSIVILSQNYKNMLEQQQDVAQNKQQEKLVDNVQTSNQQIYQDSVVAKDSSRVQSNVATIERQAEKVVQENTESSRIQNNTIRNNENSDVEQDRVNKQTSTIQDTEVRIARSMEENNLKNKQQESQAAEYERIANIGKKDSTT